MMFGMPKGEGSIIKVIGVGGGGSNAVTHMFKQGIVGVDFAISNTDIQAIETSPVPVKIQLGPALTDGRGAGSRPQIGKQACIESIEEVKEFLDDGTKMLFVTAGMGGGTGTGAAPIIAKTAREMGILTVGIVTLPFTFEGRKRTSQGGEGLEDLKNNVDTLIVISNDKLRQIHGNLSLSQAFSEADNILAMAAKGIAEIITVPGYVNVDFEDVNTVMRESGIAIMGTASAEGDDRAKRAVDDALNSPLLEDSNIKGAQHILLNITSGTKEVTMDEIFEITEFVQEEAGFGTNLIWGNCFNEELGDKISVTVIATGFESAKLESVAREDNKVVVALDDDEPISTVQKKSTPDLISVSAENSTTFEFEDIQLDKYKKTRYSYDEPYVKDEERERTEEQRRKRQEREDRRREKLRTNVSKLNNPQVINELESKPAYLRRNVRLHDIQHSSEESTLSNWSISDEEAPEINRNNSYLHDNVD